ncbi:MAG: hypothetical protein E7642_00315 [Ruminococcaceae bacterium]|nr:hypothetical protein [Oscillospiraceae bacterium]
MIYEDNRKNKELSKELFRKPTSEYRGTPFWAWNCDLERDELLRQIDVFKEMGLGGFHMHVRTGMSTEYLSDEFMSLIKACTEHAKENEMLAWLYDEDRWPSGAAGGIVTKDINMRQRYLRFTPNTERDIPEQDKLIARFDIVLDENNCLKSYKLLGENEKAEGREWLVIREISRNSPWFNGQAYVDTLNPKAIEKFIDVTYKPYAKTVGDEFGKTVPAIFTDEPQFSRKGVLPYANSLSDVTLPWTDDLDDTYTKKYGSSLIPHLPELLWDLPDGQPSLVRYRYHDHVCDRFTEAFADICGKWCDDHGLALTGHMMEEGSLHQQTHALGEAMRSYRAFGIPGIDMLCGYFEFSTAKQCQSAVHQYGRTAMLSELYGVTGWDFDFRGHKLHGDWQAALGVTVRVPHLSWVSMHGNAKRDYPASIHYQSSWYKEYSYVEDHFARVNTALTRGKPIVKVGVIHPVESYWLHFGPEENTNLVRSAIEANFNNVTQWLLRGSIDFDYISESLFPAQCKKASAPIKVGEMEYDVIIVPECETLRSTTLERLEDFKAAGGKLLFMGDAPKYENAEISQRGKALYDISDKVSFNRASLLSALDAYRTIDVRYTNGALSNDLIHQIRRDEDGIWLFLSHCDEPYNKDISNSKGYNVKLYGRYTPELWDTMSGEIKPVSFRYVGNDTVVTLELYDYDSALLFFRNADAGEDLVLPEAPAKREFAPLPERVAYTLSEPNVLLLDKARFALDDGEFEDEEEILRLDSKLRARVGLPMRVSSVVQPWVIEKKTPRWSATLEFTINSDIDVKSPILALEDAELADITFNGQHVEYKDLGYYTDISIRKTALPPIKKGKNILTIKLPFDERTNIECCYILGDFGVSVEGRHAKITSLPETLCFDRIDRQGLAFYGGAVSYELPLELDESAEVYMQTMHYRAAVMSVAVDGKKVDTIAYPPYIAKLGKLDAGKHTITLTAYISRHNCFGNIHCADDKFKWLGPDCWRTKGSTWTYEYRLLPEGLISTPIFYKV